MHRFRFALLAGTALVLPVAAQAQTVAPHAAPVLDRVVSGGITVQQGAGQTTVQQQQQRGIVDWRSFNVGQDHTVRFQQPGASSITLNRVTTPDPSTIAGRITANGQIAIVNQSGVVFTQGAQVDAAGLIVSSANISNENFMAGRMVFNQPGRPDARIENAGTITIREAGLAALVAPQVANRGTITARLGRVALAGAESHVVDLYGDGLLSIEVTGAVRQAPAGGAALVTNSGVIEAQGGTVQLTAAAADGIVQDLVRAGGRISADTDAATGRTGRIAINGTGGAVRVEGEVRTTGTARGTRGGQVEIVADRVLIDQGARVDASGRTGGGEVAIGTTLRGAASRRLAQRTGIAAGATVRADATVRGNGGTVIVNSQDYTGHAGAISARGGPRGGNGGFVEISGQGGLFVLGSADTSAPMGRSGTILIDPVDLLITNGSDTIPGSGNATIVDNVVSADSAPDIAYIYPSQFESLVGDVILQATNDITVTGAVERTGGGLTLEAGRDILVNAPMSGDGALTLTAGRDITTNSALQFTGAITLDAGRNLAVGSAVVAQADAPVALFARTGSIDLTAGQISGAGGTFAATAAINITSQTFITGFEGISLTAQTGDVLLTAEAALFGSESGGAGVSIAAGNGIRLNGGERTGGVVISTGDLVDLQAGTGGITQTAAVQAGTLQVRTTGNAMLDLAPTDPNAAVNEIGTLGASNVTGNFSLRASGTGEPLVIAEVVRVGGRFSLEALTGVIQEAPSAIITPDLSVVSQDVIDLSGDNQIASISGITGGSFGDIRIRNTTDLTIAGAVTLEASSSDASVTIIVDGGNLTVAAPISATVPEGRAFVDLVATGNVVVTAAGSVTAQGTMFDGVAIVAGLDAEGFFDPTAPSGIALAGNLTAANGRVELLAGTGGISQTAGGITAGEIAIYSGGDALLASPGNAVETLGGFLVTGTLVLDNGLNDLLVRSGEPSESIGEAGNIGIRTGGSVTLVEGANMDAIAPGGTISLRVGNLIAENRAIASSTLLEIAPFAATPMRLPLDGPVTGVFSVSADTLSHFGFQSLRLGATTFGGTTTTTADGLSIAAGLTVPATLDLRSLAGITQDAGAGIVAATLSGASGGSTVLTDQGNQVTTLAGFNAGGDFNFFTRGPLLSVPGGTIVYAGGTLRIEVGGGGLQVDGTVSGATTSLIADGTLAVNGFSAIARSGSLLLQAPVFTLDGLAEAAGDIIVEAATSATLAGTARTANALSIASPSVTFGGLDASAADVRLYLGQAGFASGALDAAGLLVQGGAGAVLTGAIAGIAGRPAAAEGRRATAGGVLLPDPPPDMNSYTFNDCAIGASACAPPPPPPPSHCRFGSIACAAIPLTLFPSGAVLAVLDPAQILDAVDQLRPPTPDLALQPTRDPTEDSELAPPDIRSGDY